MTGANQFPTRTQLWNSAIMHTIVYALFAAHYARPLWGITWDGLNYLFETPTGDGGAITFATAGTVGVFFEHESPRSPYAYGRDYNIEQFFAGIPPHLRRLADDEALQYMFEYYQEGRPGITAAFWGLGETMTSCEPWTEIFEHGAYLIAGADRSLNTMSFNPNTMLRELQQQYGLSGTELEVAMTLYQRKRAAPQRVVVLSNEELTWIAREELVGLEHSKNLLSQIGIQFS